MPRQAHDLGVRKRKIAQPKMLPERLAYERFKRTHPGPLPPNVARFSQWVESGKPRRWQGWIS